MDHQLIRDLLSQGNRFAAMNVFIQSKLGPDVSSQNNVLQNQIISNSLNKSNLPTNEQENQQLCQNSFKMEKHIQGLENHSQKSKNDFFEIDIESIESGNKISGINATEQNNNLQQSNSTEPNNTSFNKPIKAIRNIESHTENHSQGNYEISPVNTSSYNISTIYDNYCNTNPISFMSCGTMWQYHQSNMSQTTIVPTIKSSTQQKTEKIFVNPDILKKGQQKFSRDQGKPYVSRTTGKEVIGRTIGPPCNCKKGCWAKVLPGVDDIFHGFWSMGNFNEQNVYLYGNISIKPVSRHYVKSSNKRTYTFTYRLKIKGKHIEVCKEMFMSAHGLQNNRGRIGNLIKQMKTGNLLPTPDQRGKHSNRPNKYANDTIQGARTHIDNYIGKNKTMKKMYKDHYLLWCNENKLNPVSEDKYRRIYTEEFKVS